MDDPKVENKYLHEWLFSAQDRGKQNERSTVTREKWPDVEIENVKATGVENETIWGSDIAADWIAVRHDILKDSRLKFVFHQWGSGIRVSYNIYSALSVLAI